MANYFWDGEKGYSVGFVFSAPGRMENESGRPVSGETGSNMDHILQELNLLDPVTFPSCNRYDYLITNSSPRVLYAKQDHGRTEAKVSDITNPNNIERVLRDINSCSIVVLCGVRAKNIQKYIKDKKIILCCHFGNKGLRNHYPNSHEEMKGLDSSERERKRRQLCAKSIHQILQKIS